MPRFRNRSGISLQERRALRHSSREEDANQVAANANLEPRNTRERRVSMSDPSVPHRRRDSHASFHTIAR